MNIECLCPNCWQPRSVRQDQLGTTLTCLTCGEDFRAVPSQANDFGSAAKTETVRLQPVYPDFNQALKSVETPQPKIVSPQFVDFESGHNEKSTGLNYYMARAIAALICVAWTAFNVTLLIRKVASDQETFDQLCSVGRWMFTVVFFILGIRAAVAWRAGTKSFESLRRPRTYQLLSEVGAAILFFGFVVPSGNLKGILIQNEDLLGRTLFSFAAILLMTLAFLAYVAVVMGHVVSMWSLSRYAEVCRAIPELRLRATSVGKSARIQIGLVALATVAIPAIFFATIALIDANRKMEIEVLMVSAISIVICGFLTLTVFIQGIATLHTAKSLLRPAEADELDEISPRSYSRYDDDDS